MTIHPHAAECPRRQDALDGCAEQARHLFTPGPWVCDGPPDNLIVWSGPEDRVCFLTSTGPTEANARLIAAAPDLYDAAERGLEHAIEQANERGTKDAVFENIMRDVRRIEAALAKARGEA